MSADVVSLGSVNVDLVASLGDGEIADLEARYDWFPDPGETTGTDELPDGFDTHEFRTLTGGKGANQAVAAARAGADTAFLGMVGEDHAEYGTLGVLRDAGVDTDAVEIAPAPTGRAYVFVDESGENRIVSVKGANALVDSEYVQSRLETIADASVLLLQNELPRDPIAFLLDRLADADRRPTVIADPAPARALESLLSHSAIDLVTPNEVEYEVVRRVEGSGTVIRTRGPEPVIVDDGTSFSVTPPSVEAVDTTGAGDAFNGYLAARLAAGDSLRDAVETATVAASLSVRSRGAQDAIPRIEEVREFERTG